jgi:RNA polymerase sigma factor (sigma-70 family)
VNGRLVRDKELRADAAITDLMQSAAAGDQGAWEAIVARYSGLLWHVVRAYRLADSEVADVVQTTWLRLVQHVGRIRNPEALGAWLVTTARRESLRALRQAYRERPTADVCDVEAVERDEQGPEAQAVTGEVNGMLWGCVDELPIRDRTLVRELMADSPASYQEIGTILGMPIGSIGPTRARCMQRLRHAMEEAGVLG